MSDFLSSPGAASWPVPGLLLAGCQSDPPERVEHGTLAPPQGSTDVGSGHALVVVEPEHVRDASLEALLMIPAPAADLHAHGPQPQSDGVPGDALDGGQLLSAGSGEVASSNLCPGHRLATPTSAAVVDAPRDSEVVLQGNGQRPVAEAGELQLVVPGRHAVGLYRCVAADGVVQRVVLDVVEPRPATLTSTWYPKTFRPRYVSRMLAVPAAARLAASGQSGSNSICRYSATGLRTNCGPMGPPRRTRRRSTTPPPHVTARGTGDTRRRPSGPPARAGRPPAGPGPRRPRP